MSYDPRMTNPFNKVVEEYHHIEFEPDCTVWPLEEGSEAGFSTAFFREDFTIIGSETTDTPAEYRELKPHEDYVFSPLMLSVASRTGREAFSYVVILRDSIKHVKISYHAVGGVADKTLLSEISLLGVFDRTDRKIWMNLRGQELGVPSAPKDVDAIGLSAIEVLAVKLDKIYTAMTMDTLISPPLLDIIQQQQDQINAHGDTIDQIVQTAPAAHLDNRIDKILETLDFTDLQTKYPSGSYPVISGGVAQPKVAELFTGINNLLNGQLQKNAKALGTSIKPDDLFNDSDRGVYFQSTNANADVDNGYPAPYAGTLTVSKAAGIIQTYQTYAPQNRIYQRGYYNSSWTNWVEFARTNSPTFTGSPTAPTQAQSDNSTKLATTAFVKAMAGSFTGLGINQSWADYKSHRVLGNTYTNTTSAPIVVNVSINGGGECPMCFDINGVQMVRNAILHNSKWGQSSFGSIIVPPGDTYRAYNDRWTTQDNNHVAFWTELRAVPIAAPEITVPGPFIFNQWPSNTNQTTWTPINHQHSTYPVKWKAYIIATDTANGYAIGEVIPNNRITRGYTQPRYRVTENALEFMFSGRDDYGSAVVGADYRIQHKTTNQWAIVTDGFALKFQGWWDA